MEYSFISKVCYGSCRIVRETAIIGSMLYTVSIVQGLYLYVFSEKYAALLTNYIDAI